MNGVVDLLPPAGDKTVALLQHCVTSTSRSAVPQDYTEGAEEQ